MKRFFTFAILLFLTLSASAQRPKVGVVLCGGGAKGAAHVGVLKVLEENQRKVMAECDALKQALLRKVFE